MNCSKNKINIKIIVSMPRLKPPEWQKEQGAGDLFSACLWSIKGDKLRLLCSAWSIYSKNSLNQTVLRSNLILEQEFCKLY